MWFLLRYNSFSCHEVAFHWFRLALHFHMPSVFEVELGIKVFRRIEKSGRKKMQL